MVHFKNKDSSSGPQGGLWCSTSFLGFSPLPLLPFVTALSHSSSVITSEVQRAIGKLYWIQGQASLRPRAQGFSLGIQSLRFTPGYIGNVVGWGWVGTGSEYQLLPSRIYSLVKSELVLANINLEVVCSAFSFCLFLQNGIFIWMLTVIISETMRQLHHI